jgi:hypothetical protein
MVNGNLVAKQMKIRLTTGSSHRDAHAENWYAFGQWLLSNETKENRA